MYEVQVAISRLIDLEVVLAVSQVITKYNLNSRGIICTQLQYAILLVI